RPRARIRPARRPPRGPRLTRSDVDRLADCAAVLTKRLDVRIATCAALPEPDDDEPVLAAALAAAGLVAALAGWDDPAAAWDAAIPTVLRPTWNSPLAPAAFLAWLDRAAAAAPVINPPDIVRRNVHKRYLLDLAARGVPVVPTTLVERGQSCE